MNLKNILWAFLLNALIEEMVNVEVEISGLGWYRHVVFTRRTTYLVVLLVIPVTFVSLCVPVVSNLVIIKATEEVFIFNEENSIKI